VEERGVIQDIWEHFDFKYMQPIFLKELIPHREFQIIRDKIREQLLNKMMRKTRDKTNSMRQIFLKNRMNEFLEKMAGIQLVLLQHGRDKRTERIVTTLKRSK
jgi:hypothetical protein